MRGCQAPHPAAHHPGGRGGRSDTGATVPVPDLSLLSPLADPDHLDARRRLPDSRIGASVPVMGLDAVTELQPLVGVRQGRILELSRQRG